MESASSQTIQIIRSNMQDRSGGESLGCQRFPGLSQSTGLERSGCAPMDSKELLQVVQ